VIMAYATYLHGGISHVGEVHGSHVVPLAGLNELGDDTTPEVLAEAHRDETASVPVQDVTFRPVVPNPSKVFCIGLNYRDHAEETHASFAANLRGKMTAVQDDRAQPVVWSDALECRCLEEGDRPRRVLGIALWHAVFHQHVGMGKS